MIENRNMIIKKHQLKKSISFPNSNLVKIFIVVLSIFIYKSSFTSDSSIRVVETPQGYQFYDSDKPVLFYQVTPKTTTRGTHSRANYCHPVYGINGEMLTDDFPKDHLHHRGIFWAWHQVNIGDTRIHDMWECKNFIWDVHKVQILENQESSSAIRAHVFWKSPHWKNGNNPFAKETVTIRVHEVKNSTRAIDFTIEMIALEEGLRIGGSENRKEYGGFSTRIVLPKDIRMNDSSGVIKPQRNLLPAGDWLNFAGIFGKENSNLAIFVHPSNPGYPRNWVLRKSRSMQNAAYPGRKPIPISTKKPLVLKYRLVLHNGADLNKLFDDYCKDKCD